MDDNGTDTLICSLNVLLMFLFYLQPMTQTYYVYILVNAAHSGFYIDVSRSLSAYKIKTRDPRKLVHIERFDDLGKAVTRVETLKRWSTPWVSALINEKNKGWKDLDITRKLAA